jgi:hypothetical protein
LLGPSIYGDPFSAAQVPLTERWFGVPYNGNTRTRGFFTSTVTKAPAASAASH